jgi:hypothetical protein
MKGWDQEKEVNKIQDFTLIKMTCDGHSPMAHILIPALRRQRQEASSRSA